MDANAADRDLEQRVLKFIAGRYVSGVRYVNVQAEAGTVTLRGNVPSYHTRQLCLECCRHVAGVVRVVDRLKVVPPTRRSDCSPLVNAERE